MSFYFINIFYIFDLLRRMSMKVQFIKKIPQKIQTDPKEKNIERV
jgi:hypothetical protein